MNRRSTLMALVAAGCGAGQTTAPREPAEIAHRATASGLTADPSLDLEAGARMWRALAPTGADYQQKLDELPAELARPMAIALLREGEFACNAFEEEYGCADTWYVLAPLEPAATVDDPCLRRYLALWALEQLEPDDAIALSDVLVDLASMSDPETELPEAAFALAPDDATRLRMIAGASGYFGETWASSLETDAARLHAFVDLGMESASEQLDVAAHRDALRPVLVDDRISTYRRADLVSAFTDDADPRTTRALVELTSESDCALAMRAAEALAERGDPSFLPARPRSHDPEDHLRAMCLLGAASAQVEDAVWASWFAEDGYESTFQTDDGYHDEEEEYVVPEPEIETIDGGYDDRLISGAWTCDGLICTTEGYRSVTVTFAPAPDGLVVSSIESYEYNEGCGC